MQTMARRTMLTLAAVVAPFGVGAVSVLSVQRAAGHATSGLSVHSAQWRSCLEAEAEDKRFWASEWSALEAELVQLQAVANAPAANATAAKSPEHKHSKSPLAGLKLNLEPKTAADLVPALAMLKGLYEDGKARIGKLNLREKESKKRFEDKQGEHVQRIATIEARFKNGTLSAEFRTNETHDENRLWNYWEKVRERQHKQYHTSLKIQHATLEKVKAMMDMYEKTISGKADKAQVAKELSKVSGGALPEVVFLQQSSKALANYCAEALSEVRSQRAELLQTSSSTASRVQA